MRPASLALLALLAVASPLRATPPAVHSTTARVTILYDAFGMASGLTQDWGFAALIEYDGRRILFDTGDNAVIFERNVRALHVDLRRLDFAVISHRHSDHIAGLSYLLRINPKVKIYAPRESFGVFGSSLPSPFIAPIRRCRESSVTSADRHPRSSRSAPRGQRVTSLSSTHSPKSPRA